MLAAFINHTRNSANMVEGSNLITPVSKGEAQQTAVWA